jgi:type 1 glutamine amidotransferase
MLAGDHEYRGEETLPAMARILAKHYGFKCSVFFTIDPETGFIQPGSSKIGGLEALRDADLMVVFLRFQNFPEDQMQHFADYVDRGGPIVGLRTSTHAFKMSGGPFGKYSTGYNGDDFKGGFGRQILGETWVGHYGRNHKQSSLLILEQDQLEHPVLRGVKKPHAQCGGYRAFPIEGSVTLARGRVLNGMQADAEPDTSKEELPVAWVRQYEGKSGRKGRVFTTTHGASEDILNDDFRRMMINSCLWAAGLDDAIKADGPIDFVGPYNPVTFGFGGYRKGVKPADIAGWDTPILSAEPATAAPK